MAELYVLLGFFLGMAMMMIIDGFTILKDVRKLNDEMETK